jgi:hypothetical protein
MTRSALPRLAATLLIAGVVALALQPENEDPQLVREFCHRAAEDPTTARGLGEGWAFDELMVTLHRHQQLHLQWCARGAIEPAGRAVAPLGVRAPRRWRATPPAASGVAPVYFLVSGPRGAPKIQDVLWPSPAVRPEPFPWWRRRWF